MASNDDVLVQVASRMRQANLAEVMGRMDPDRARALTQMLADRARPPTSGGDLLGALARRTAPAAGGGLNPRLTRERRELRSTRHA